MAGFFTSWSKVAADNATADSTINWAEGQTPGSVNNSSRAEMASAASWRDDNNGTLSTAGSSNAYTIAAPNIAYAAYATGITIGFKANHSNTTAATLNVNALGAKAIRMFSTAGDIALVGGEIQSSGHYTVRYDAAANSAAGAWVILNPTLSTFSITSLSISGALAAGATTITSASASALTVGANGASNPVLKINDATASVATGIHITGAAAASGVAVAAISSGTDEALTIDAKGAGSLTLQATATGTIRASRNVVPTTDGAAALGTVALGFNGLHLAIGTNINWSNGNAEIRNDASGVLRFPSTTAVRMDAGLVITRTGTGATFFINGESDDGGGTLAFAAYYGNTAASAGEWSFLRTRGTFSSPSNMSVGDRMGKMAVVGREGGSNKQGGCILWEYAASGAGSGAPTQFRAQNCNAAGDLSDWLFVSHIGGVGFGGIADARVNERLRGSLVIPSDRGLYGVKADGLSSLKLIGLNGTDTVEVGAPTSILGGMTVSGSTTLAALSATTGSFSSTLAVTGASTIAALSATTGTFSSTLSVSSTLAVTGSFTVNTNKFTVNDSNGNTTVAGTLGVTGASTIAALSATSGTFSTTLSVTGASTIAALSATSGAFSTTLSVTGNATVSGSGGVAARNTAKAFLVFTTDGAGAVTLVSNFNASVATQTVNGAAGFRVTFAAALGTSTYSCVGNGFTTSGTGLHMVPWSKSGSIVDIFLMSAADTRISQNIQVEIAIFENA